MGHVTSPSVNRAEDEMMFSDRGLFRITICVVWNELNLGAGEK